MMKEFSTVCGGSGQAQKFALSPHTEGSGQTGPVAPRHNFATLNNTRILLHEYINSMNK